jgi:tetratricopeptide (TPR) repeat protein
VISKRNDNMKDYLYIDSADDTRQARFKVSDTPKIDRLIKEKRFSEALIEIDRILEIDCSHSNLNLKGIILENLGEYEQSIECFDKALRLHQSDDIKLNRANCLYAWAKVTFFPNAYYDKALRLIDCGLDSLPDSEDPSEFYFLKAEILEGSDQLAEAHKCYLTAYKEFDRLREFESQCNYLSNTTDTLVNIVGSDFYNFTPEIGGILTLMKDEDNEHDPDAVAAIHNGETVGYVANNPYTLIDEVKSASDIRNLIADNQKAEILFIYLGEYVIAKLLD